MHCSENLALHISYMEITFSHNSDKHTRAFKGPISVSLMIDNDKSKQIKAEKPHFISQSSIKWNSFKCFSKINLQSRKDAHKLNFQIRENGELMGVAELEVISRQSVKAVKKIRSENGPQFAAANIKIELKWESIAEELNLNSQTKIKFQQEVEKKQPRKKRKKKKTNLINSFLGFFCMGKEKDDEQLKIEKVYQYKTKQTKGEEIMEENRKRNINMIPFFSHKQQ